MLSEVYKKVNISKQLNSKQLEEILVKMKDLDSENLNVKEAINRIKEDILFFSSPNLKKE